MKYFLIVVLYTLIFLFLPLRPFEVVVLSLIFFTVTALEIGSIILHRRMKKYDNDSNTLSERNENENNLDDSSESEND